MIISVMPPAVVRDRPLLAFRRITFAALVLGTMAGACAVLAHVLGADGPSPFDGLILSCFLVTLPWNVINFWNSAIGLFLLTATRQPLASVVPQLRRLDLKAPLRGRTAILMPIYNEEPQRVFRHLEATLGSLDETGEAARFELFVLSDTRDPEIAARERELFAAWRASDPSPRRLNYRRRVDNVGAKSANIWEFIEGPGARFDYFLVLDADSLMTGAAITRLVRLMDSDPLLGIVQTQIAGLPSRSAFARIFQFGMRHGMRAYTMGSAWWQGDGGPYWGHNAILRLAPFRDHCRLPILAGRAPFGGRILSHDQVEAVLMRRAGYEVRVLPDEHGSFEENPPTLPDFLKRDLRWCQGNMQYGKVLRLPGLTGLGRVQLLLAILMYVQAPAWMLFMALGMAQAVAVALGMMTPTVVPDPARAALATELGITLFVVVMAMVFAPKLAGIAQTLLQPAVRRSYGGGLRVAASAVVELVFSLLIAPVMAVTHTKFIALLFFGRTVIWTEQARNLRSVPFTEALRNLWFPVLVGVGFTAVAWAAAPGALPWLAPVVTGLILAPVFAWATALPGFGAWLARLRICAVPEEFAPPEEVREAGYAALPTMPQGFAAASGLRLAGVPIDAAKPAATLQKSD